MSSVSPKAGPLTKRPSSSPKLFPEQIRTFFVYHPMKLLILGLLAVALFAAGSSRDCFWQWSSEARQKAIEARERVIEARQEARERAREFRAEQRDAWRARRDAWRAQRDAAREQRDRIRDQIRRQIREDLRDWRYTY